MKTKDTFEYRTCGTCGNQYAETYKRYKVTDNGNRLRLIEEVDYCGDCEREMD